MITKMIKFKSVWQEMQHTKVTKSNEIINYNIKTAGMKT
jgi:hypothetical protein